MITWPSGRCVTWLCGGGSLILSHHPPKFGVHRPCEIGDITFFICHVTTNRRVTWLCGWGPFILSHHSAKFGVHRPYGTRNNDISNIISNSNSSAEVYKWPESPFQMSSKFNVWSFAIFRLIFKLTSWSLYPFEAFFTNLSNIWTRLCANPSRKSKMNTCGTMFFWHEVKHI